MSIQIKTKKILSKENISKIITMGISLRDGLSNLELGLISDYDNTKTYTRGMAVYYDDYLYKCLYTTTGIWNETKWQKVGDDLSLVTKQDVEAMLNLSDEEIKTLQSLILDTSIELSHTWSSSKVYTEIQNAIKKGEEFTLSKLASTMTASFKIATNISDITASNILYLLSIGANTYDIYALIDGTPTPIASTTIDLSSYVKLTDLADYLKKFDADGKYALITTVDGKIDKTSISTSMSTTPSDEKVLSEKAIKTELDKKANDSEVVKFENIISALDNSNTEKELLSAKGLYETLSSNVVETYNTSEDTVSDIVSGLRTIKGTLPIKVIRLYDDNKKIFGVAGNYLGIIYHPNNQNEIGCYFVNHWNPSIVYSAKIENNDTQLKVSKIFTSGDIVTEINSTNTDAQIPSAKSINTLINNLKVPIITFSNSKDLISQITETFSSKDMMFAFKIFNTTVANNKVPEAGNFQGIVYGEYGKYFTIIMTSVSSSNIYRGIVFNGNFVNWRRLCTTSVADVVKTNIKLSYPSNAKDNTSYIFYSVTNGVCTITYDLSFSATSEISWVNIATGLPVPKDNNIKRSTPAHNGQDKPIVFDVNSEGALSLYIASATTTTNLHYIDSFSYPVAES